MSTYDVATVTWRHDTALDGIPGYVSYYVDGRYSDLQADLTAQDRAANPELPTDYQHPLQPVLILMSKDAVEKYPDGSDAATSLAIFNAYTADADDPTLTFTTREDGTQILN